MGSKGKGGRGRFQPGRAALMKQVQQLQAQMLQVQEELAEQTVSASVGGGAVTVVMNGQQEVRGVTIDPEAVDPDEVEMLQDLIVAAMNEAMTKSRQLAEEKMAPFTGALNMAGLM
jgi:DNA-binding YbaB/EbfC family protein